MILLAVGAIVANGINRELDDFVVTCLSPVIAVVFLALTLLLRTERDPRPRGRGRRRRATVAAVVIPGMIDNGHVKQSNDTHGHDVGDAVLSAATRTLAGQLRPRDFVAPWGGEKSCSCRRRSTSTRRSRSPSGAGVLRRLRGRGALGRQARRPQPGRRPRGSAGRALSRAAPA